MDFSQLYQMLIEAAFLSVLVMALFEWAKKAGLHQNLWELSSFGFGFVIGAAYWFAVHPVASYADGFWGVLFALSVALGGPGLYDALKA